MADLHKFYDNAISKGVIDPEVDYNSFVEAMKDANERKSFYLAATRDGLRIGTEQEFGSYLNERISGLATQQQPTDSRETTERQPIQPANPSVKANPAPTTEAEYQESRRIQDAASGATNDPNQPFVAPQTTQPIQGRELKMDEVVRPKGYENLTDEQLNEQIAQLSGNVHEQKARELYKARYGKDYVEPEEPKGWWERYFGNKGREYANERQRYAEAVLDASRIEELDNPGAAKRRNEQVATLKQEKAYRERQVAMPKLGEEIKDLQQRILSNEKQDGNDMRGAKHLLNQTIDLYNAPSKYGRGSGIANWGQGLADQITDYDTWTAGVTELVRYGNLNGIVNKMNKGGYDTLTKEEQLLLETFLISTAVQDMRSDLSTGYEIGKGAAESIPFMVEMYLTAGAGAAAKRGLVQLAERKVGKAFAEKLARSLGGTAIRDAAGNLVERGATQTVAGKVGKTLAYDFAQTAAMPSTYSNIYKDRVTEILQGDGNYGFKDLARSFTGQMVETGTERWGGRLIDRGMSKMIPIDATALWGKNKLFGHFVENYINSPIGETGEEVIAAGVNTLRSLNPLYYHTDDKSVSSNKRLRGELGEMLTPEGLGKTFLTILPMSIFGGGANAAMNRMAANAIVRDYGQSRQALQSLLESSGATPEEANRIVNQIEASDSDRAFFDKMNMAYNNLLRKYMMENPNAPIEDVKAYQQQLDQVLGDYTKQAGAYNQMVGDLMEKYEKLSDNEKRTVDSAMEDYMVRASEEFASKQQPQDRQTQLRQQAAQQAQQEVQGMSHQDGNVYYVGIKGKEDAEGYAVSGALGMVTDKDGMYSTSGRDLVTVKMNDGSVEQVPADELVVRDLPVSANELMQEKADHLFAKYANNDLFQIGDKVHIMQNGQPSEDSSTIVNITDEGVEVEIIDPNGQPNTTVIPHEQAAEMLSKAEGETEDGIVTYQTQDGNTVRLRYMGNGVYQSIVSDGETPEIFTEDELAQAGAVRVDQPAAQEAPTTPREATTPEQTPAYPQDEEGNPAWGQIEVPQAAQILYDTFKQNNTAAISYADDQLKEAEKVQKKAATQKSHNLNIAQRIAEDEQNAQFKAAADAAVKYWQDVKLSIGQIKTAEEQAAKEAQQIAMQQAREQRSKTEEGTTTAPTMAERYNAAAKIEGNTGTMTLPDGRELSGRYMLIAPQGVTPSHDVTNNFQRAEGYPVTSNGQSINDRDYTNDLEEQQKVQSIAQNFNGNAIKNMPVISDEGLVYNGNGRMMAGLLAAINGTDAAYTQSLMNNAAQYGFTPEQVASIPHARVVFQLDERLPYSTQSLAIFNEQETQTQSNTGKAAGYARKLTPQAVSEVLAAVDGFQTIDAFYNDKKAPFDLINSLISTGIIAQREKAEMVDGDKLSATGRERLSNILFGTVFDNETIRLMGDDAALKNSILRALPQILDNKSLGEFSLEADINDAIRLLYQVRNAGVPFRSFVSQTVIAEDGQVHTAAEGYTPYQLLLAEEMSEGGVDAFRDVLTSYNNEARNVQGGQVDIFGDLLTPTELKNLILQRYGKEPNEQERPSAGREADNPAESTPASNEPAAEVSEPAQPAPQLIYAKNYYNDNGAREVAHGIKDNNLDSIFKAADDMYEALKPYINDMVNGGGITFIPVPSRNGKADTNFKLAALISQRVTNDNPAWRDGTVFVRDVLQGNERESLYDIKKAGRSIPDGDFFGYRLTGELPTQGTIVLVDGVYATGATMNAAREVVGSDAVSLVYAYDDTAEANTPEERLTKAEAETDTNPTEAQKKAENYKQGHVTLWGLPITIENPKGSIRRGTDANGKKWEQDMHHTYGKIRRTEGVDGDHIDVFIGPNLTSDKVFVVDQRNVDTGEFDEHKVMLGFDSLEDAQNGYLSNYEEGWQGMGTVTEVTMDEFKKWIDSSHRKTKPFADYKSVKPEGAASTAMQTDERLRDELAVELRKFDYEVQSPSDANVRYDIDDLRNAVKDILTRYNNPALQAAMDAINTSLADQRERRVEWVDVEKEEDALVQIIRDIVGDKAAPIPTTPRVSVGTTPLTRMSKDEILNELQRYAAGNLFDMSPRMAKRIISLSKKYGKGLPEEFENMASNAKYLTDLVKGKAKPEAQEENLTPLEAAQKRKAAREAAKTVEQKNTIFTDEAYEAAKARMKARLNRLNMGIDPEMVADQIVIAGYHVERGARKFADFARALIADFGDGIRQYARQMYNFLRDIPQGEPFRAEMDDYATVMAFDIDNFDKNERKNEKNAENILINQNNLVTLQPKEEKPVSPMMKQFQSIKEQYPDATLMFRVGDFYELYEEDAVEASKILGITLTKRKDGRAFAGFPFHALDTYLPKLVRAGKRVAICDQLEDPKKTTKTVKRGVSELVTPGTPYQDTPKVENTEVAEPESVTDNQEPTIQEPNVVTDTVGEITESKHTKTGNPIWIVKPLERVGNDEFRALRKRAKENNGYYSTFVKGYVFNSVNDANRFNNISDVQTTTEQGRADSETAISTAETASAEAEAIRRDSGDTSGAAGELGGESVETGVSGSRDVELTPDQAAEQTQERKDAIQKIDEATERIDKQLAELTDQVEEETPEEEPAPTSMSEVVEQAKQRQQKAKQRQQKLEQTLDLFAEAENSTPAMSEQTEPINNKDNGSTEVRNDGERESSTPQGRTAGQPADQNGTLGGSQRQANEGTQSGGVGSRSEQYRVHDGERGLGTAGQRSTESVEEPVAEGERKNTHNFRYDPADPAPTSNKARYEANLAAIRLLKQLQDEDRQATPEEQRILAKFTGWGGLGEFFKGEPGTTYWSDHGEKSPYQVIKELLTDEEMQAAQLSRNSAYFTPPAIIDELWNVAKHLGFKGGNILEGSAGIGNILSQMPQSISDRSNLQAVEIDSITAGILAQLYPDAQVHAAGFQEVDIPNNSQDLVITNVPFVTGLRVYDKKEKDLSKRFGNIHDFCIAKNVRKLRQGGIGIFITTSGTLDSSKDLRRWLNNEGETDVIAAFRLNRETFGGTSATSDIIVVRKRVNDQKDPRAIDVLDTAVARVAAPEPEPVWDRKTNSWVNDTPEEKKLIYNRYFVEHPESMGGEMGFGFEHGDTRWGGTISGCYPSPAINQSERLQEWVEAIPTTGDVQTVTVRESNNFNPGTYEEYHGDLPYGSLVLNSKDEICRVYNGMVVPVEGINPTKVKGHTKAEVLKDYNTLKAAVEELLAEQAKGISDDGLKGLLKKLNRAYDDFVKKYGNLNRNVSLSFLRNDVEWASMAALENVRETIEKNGKKQVEVSKTDVFSKRVVGVQAEPRAENARDGVILSVQQYGNVRPDMIAMWLERPQEDVEKEIIESRLAFRDPQTGNMVVSHEYLSGNVREKLAYAEEHNENGIYDTNIEELRKVIPVDIPAHLIEFNIGSTWIPVELYHKYLKEKFGVESLQLVHVGSAWISNEQSYGGYALRNEKNRAEGVYSEILMEQVYGHQLMIAAMNNVPVVVSKTEKHRDGTTETITDKAATAACSDKISQIKDDFVEWARGKMQEDSELAERVQKIYNERFNAIVPMLSVDKAFLSPHLPGQNHKYTLYDHQQQAVVRATTQPVMLAHEVGTGKTITLISSAMEMRRLGTAKKPMIVVQNATTPQFIKEAKDLYPNAKILTVSERDRTKEGRQEFYAKIKYNDWDLIIVPQSVFDMIPDSESRMRDFIQEKIDEKMHAIEAAKEANVDAKVTKRMEKELEALQEDLQNANMSGKRSKSKSTEKDAKKEAERIENAKARAEEMLDRRTDEVEDFDDMGIDALLIDEAHNYKHLGFATMMTRGVKGIDPSYSKRAAALYLKCQSVYERCGHRNVVFATGTPISNTAAEIWTFMKYLMPKEVLKDNDIYYFDDFVHNFGKIAEQLEFATNGKFKANNRFAQYGNVPELMRIWLTCADCVLTREVGQVNDKVPELEGGKAQDIFLPQSPSLIDIMASVRAELERYEKMSGKEKKENSHIPLTMYGVAKRAAIDPRLVDANAADEPLSKTNKAVEETLRSLKETKKYNGTVAIFCDSYRNLQTGFNLFEDIKAKLVKAGVPAAKIAIIRSEMTDAAKQKIFDAVREGEIRVIMGSTQTLGTGVNIQTRLHTLIHMDAPDRPMDYTQRNGRIIRQGNMHRQWNLPVRVLRFGVEDSLDVTSYQRLKTKAGFIDSIMNGKSMIDNNLENRVLEDVEEGIFDNPVAMLSGSQYALLKSQAERDLRKWQARKQQHDIDQILIAKKLKDNAKIIEYRRQLITIDEQFLQTLKQTFPTGKVTEYNIDGTICHTAAELKEALKAINAEIQARADKLRKDGYEGSKQNIAVSLQFNGMPFNVNIVLIYNSRWESGQRAITINKEVQYTTPTSDHWLGSPTKVLDKLVEHIEQDYLSGTQATGEINYSRSYIERLQQENELMRQREGKPFEHGAELEKAQALVDEYTEKMQDELAEKEAKYANMSSGRAVTLNEQDDEEETPEAQITNLDYPQFSNQTEAQQLATAALVEVLNDNTDLDVFLATDEEAAIITGDDNAEFNIEFNNFIDRFKKQSLKRYESLTIGLTAGMRNYLNNGNQLLMNQSVLTKAKNKHNINIDSLRDLPEKLSFPIAVFKSARPDVKGKVVLIEVKDNDNHNIVVSVNMEATQNGIEVNEISSIYGRENFMDFARWTDKGLLEYGDIEKFKAWYASLPEYNSQGESKTALEKIGAKLQQISESTKFLSKKSANNSEIPEFSIRKEPAPKKTGIGYKVFCRGKDGKLYPPMVANPNGEATPVGVWLNADAAPVAGESKTGRPQVKAGGKGTQGGSGQLAYRPGWHLGEIPYALQFNRKDENGEKTLFPKDFVWAEVEYAADKDYQEEAMREGVNTSGKFQHSLAGLKHVPTDGFYRYRTNPNPATDPWIITGAMKVNRILTNEEVDEIVRAAGREPQVREAMLTPNGTLYGWAIGDRIYLTKDGLNPNSPIHEYSHIWAKAMMRNNREGWQSIVDIFKGTPFWDEVVNDPNYQGLTTDDAICSEVLARYSGQRGAARMEEWAKEELYEAEQSGSVLQGAKIRRLISRTKKALADFWHWVGTNLFGIKHFDSAEQVADRILWDMLNGTELGDVAGNNNQYSQVATDAWNKYQYDGELESVRDVADYIEENMPKDATTQPLFDAIDKYRSEEEEDRMLYGERGDLEPFEDAIFAEIEKLMKSTDNTAEAMISGYTQEKQRTINEWYAAHPRPQYQVGEKMEHYQARLEQWNKEYKAFNEQMKAGMPTVTSAEKADSPVTAGTPAFVPGVRPTPMANETPSEYALRLRQYYQLMRDERLVAEYVTEINNQADAAAKVLKKNTIVRGLLDAAKPIENFQEWMKQRGATITDESNAYTDTFLATGRVTEANEQMQRDIIRPLAKQIAKIIAPDAKTGKSRLDGINIVWHNMDIAGTGSKLDGKALTPREIIGVYCQAKDCAEAIEKGLPDRGAKGFLNNLGMSHDDVIAAVESVIPRAELDELWRLINAATHFALNYDYESGRISEDTRTEFYQREFYVPQRGWRERDESGLITEYEPVGKRGNDPYNAALVKAHGRQSLASDPFAYIMSIDASSIVSSENNKIKQKFLQFCLDNENLGLQTGAFRVKKYWIMNVIDPETGKIKLDEEGNPMMEVSYVAPTAEDLSHDRTIKELIKKKRKEWAKVNQAYLERQSHGELGPQLEAAYKTKLSKIEQAIEDLEQQMHIAWNATNTNITQRTSDEKKQHEVRVLLDGQEYLIEVQDEKLANAINKKFKQHQEQLFNTSQKMRNATRFMSAVLTQYNPEFAASNFARDFQVALATLTAEHLELVGSFLKNFAACQPAVWQYAFNDKVRDRAVFRDSELGRYLHEYFKAGAATGFSYMQDLKSLRQDFDAMVNESNLRRGIKGAVGTLSMLTEVSETAVRFAGYVSARQKGMGINEAAYLSKELTTNFDRAGEVADSGWMSWFSFFRATLNGNIKFLKALKKMPVAYSIIAAAYVAMGMLNQFLNPDDPEDEVWVGDYTRQSNFVIGKWRIPTAHFLRMFFAAGVNAAKWMQGEKSFGEATYNTANFASQELLPNYLNLLGNGTEWNSREGKVDFTWEGLLQGVMPSPVSPIADVYFNRDFRGATINREPFAKSQEGTKDILLSKENTLPVYKWLTQAIYEGVGGNMNAKYQSDDSAWRSWLFDTSASSVEHVVEGYMPAGMDMFITLSEAIYDAATGTATGPDKWPFVRKFYNAYTPERAYMQQYYLLNGRVKEFKRNMDDYRKNDRTKYNILTHSQEYRNYQEAERLVKKQKENPTTADVQALINANKQWLRKK